jgi:hypothetical protein
MEKVNSNFIDFILHKLNQQPKSQLHGINLSITLEIQPWIYQLCHG